MTIKKAGAQTGSQVTNQKQRTLSLFFVFDVSGLGSESDPDGGEVVTEPPNHGT